MQLMDGIFGILLLFNTYLHLTLLYLYRERRGRRRWWVRPINKTRNVLGYYNNQFKEAYETDHEEFFNMTRMTPAQYHVCHLVSPFLTKRSLRESISVNERVAMTLLFFAHGDSARSKSWEFRIGRSTIHKIIYETSDAIWKALNAQYLPEPSQETWEKVIDGFWNKWNFPNCIGALDGKHITIQAPPNSSNSDGGVWANSNFGQSLESGIADVSPSKSLPGTMTMLPCALVRDEAFPLKSYLMRPYPRRSLTNDSQRIFNYRLSRARRTIENAFGILVS